MQNNKISIDFFSPSMLSTFRILINSMNDVIFFLIFLRYSAQATLMTSTF